jgi:hypothetical protein
LNLIARASVLVIQYVTDYTRALQILRWMIGSLDVVGFDLICNRILVILGAPSVDAGKLALAEMLGRMQKMS